ncbi:MAG TPA: hypothetical protein VKH19_04045 [Gemmatimonadaceae bacterium]|nr:hypothetical protein [Gemmatimonadaceae bacterium]
MKKLAIVLLLVAASCRRSVAVGSPTPGQPGGSNPRDAIAKFMASAKAQDLQAMSLAWGSPQGPIRETRSREEIEQREVILMCHLKHDSYRVVNEAPAVKDERQLNVEVKYRDLTKVAPFFVGQGPSQRWYVFRFDLDPLREICARH